MHYEVETKIKLRNSEVQRVKKRIKEIATISKKTKKTDEYFAIQKNGYPKKAFRIRKTKDGYEVCFKKPRKELWSKDVVVKEEYEFKIPKDNLSDFLELFRDLGFKEWVKKEKQNETYKYKKNKKASIEINKVKLLGYFIEIEYLCQKGEIKKAIKEIEGILDQIGIDKKQIDNTGYTLMLWSKKQKFPKGI